VAGRARPADLNEEEEESPSKRRKLNTDDNRDRQVGNNWHDEELFTSEATPGQGHTDMGSGEEIHDSEQPDRPISTRQASEAWMTTASRFVLSALGQPLLTLIRCAGPPISGDLLKHRN